MSSVAHLMPGIRDRVRSTLSDEFLAQLEIQNHAMRAATVLTNHTFNGLQRSFIEILENDLDTLETRMPTQTHLRIYIGILASRLRLCAIPMLSRVSSTTEEQGPDTWSRAIWYRGFHTSVQLVNLFADSALSGDATPTGGQKAVTIYCPKIYFYILMTAGMYFINLVATDGDISTNNRVLAQNHIKRVYEILLHWSRESRDEMSRAAAVIDLLSHHVDAQDPSKLQETPSTMPTTTSVITNGLKMVDQLRNKLLKPVSRLRADVSSPQASDWPDFSDGLEQGFLGDDLLEWNTLFPNMDGITSLFHTPLPTPGDKSDMNT